MRKHGGDGLLGKGETFGFDMRDKAQSRPYNGRDGFNFDFGFFFLVFFTTLLSLHFTTQTIITTEMSCMERQPFVYSIVCLQANNQHTKRASGRDKGSPGLGGKRRERGKGEFRTFVCIIICLLC